MAKVTGPLFSLKASGKFGDSIVFSSWKGLNIARKYTKPGGEPSARQRLIQGYFAEATGMYGLLTPADRQAWNMRVGSRPMTGYNLFIKNVMDSYTAGALNYNLIRELEVSGEEFGLRVSFTADEPAPMLVSWGLEGEDFSHSLRLDEDDFDEEGRASFLLENLEEDMRYNLRLVQTPIMTGTPEDVTFLAQGEEGGPEYEFLVAAITSSDELLLDTGRIHLLSPGPETVDEENPLEMSWEKKPGIEEYLVYLLDREEERLELVGRTEDESLSWQGDRSEEYRQLQPGWEQEQPSELIYLTGESGDYSFSPAGDGLRPL